MPFRYLSAGESHGPSLTVIVEGVPAGLALDESLIAADLARRQLKAGAGGRMDIETDRAQILSGVMGGLTTGAPIALSIPNRDHAAWRGKAVPAYTIARPGHADLAACAKYGHDDIRRSLERSSARETACRVAVGAIARAYLDAFGVRARSYVAALGAVPEDTSIPLEEALAFAEASPSRAPSQRQEDAYANAIHLARANGETLGGLIVCAVAGLPIGLGSYATPDRRLDARLGAAVLSVNAIKGVAFADAFANIALPGSACHDAILLEGDRIVRPTDRAGGLEGGMTTGQSLLVRAAMKPIPTTLAPQRSVDLATHTPAQTAYERSDTCPVPRACVVIESVLLIELAAALCEKLGGDSLDEQRARFAALPTADSVRLNPAPKIFWPEP